MKIFDAIRNWFKKTFSRSVVAANSTTAELEQPVASITGATELVQPVSVNSSPELVKLAGHSISGNAGIASANILVVGPVSNAAVADVEGFYSFKDLPDGAYVVKPSAPTPGHTFRPEIQVVVIAGADVLNVDFIDPSSVVDSRAVTATTPNSSRTVQGTLIYDVQKAESRTQGAPVDCRVAPNIPVDSRVSPNIPQNSRA